MQGMCGMVYKLLGLYMFFIFAYLGWLNMFETSRFLPEEAVVKGNQPFICNGFFNQVA